MGGKKKVMQEKETYNLEFKNCEKIQMQTDKDKRQT